MQCLCHHWKLANTVFSEQKKKRGGSSRGSRVVGDGAVRRTMNSTIQHLICPLFLPVSLPLYLFNRLSSPPCLLFHLSAQRMAIFFFFLTQHSSDTAINTSLPKSTAHKNVKEKQIELLGDLNFNNSHSPTCTGDTSLHKTQPLMNGRLPLHP